MNKFNIMALILPVNGIYPRFGKNCFLAENATIIGEVETRKKNKAGKPRPKRNF